VGLRSIAALGAAFAGGFTFYAWLTPADEAVVNAVLHVEPSGLAVSSAAHKDLVAPRPNVAGSDIRPNDPMPMDRLDTAWDFALRWDKDNLLGPISARASFGERFAFDRLSAPASLQPAQGSVSFDDRFRGETLVSGGAGRSAVAAGPQKSIGRVVTAAAAPSRDARSQVVRAGAKRPPSAGFQLASASETSIALGYAPADSVKSSGVTSSLNGLLPKDSEPLADIDTSRTAIYDITSRTVYLPNGRRLEAHSGLGVHMDNPRSVAMTNTGPTPPNVYELKMRESLFHGVRAIRLIPKDDSKMYGRDGILAHSYMLGPNGQSNGCISFSDYSAFLDAYLRGDITRLVVVDHLADVPSRKTASDWLSNTLKDIFRRS
jgi:Protein of unknown function (DUF2778)